MLVPARHCLVGLAAFCAFASLCRAATDTDPKGIRIEAESAAASDSKKIVDETASGKAAVSNNKAWQPLTRFALPAEGGDITIFIRHRGGPIQLKTADASHQMDRDWVWANPADWTWSRVGHYRRADLLNDLIFMRGEGFAPVALDCVVIASGDVAAPSPTLPPFEPDASKAPEKVEASIDWSAFTSLITPRHWSVNDYEILTPDKAGDPALHTFFDAIHPGMVRIHNAELCDQWTNHDTHTWNTARIKAGFDAMHGFGDADLMINIPRWPSWIATESDGTLSTTGETQFVALVGALPAAIRSAVGPRRIYYELLNELDDRYEKANRLDQLWALHNRLFDVLRKNDPAAKIGGPALTWAKPLWLESFLKACGGHVDFITWHNYGTGDIYESNAALFAAADTLERNCAAAKQTVERLIPGRSPELFLSEYNVKWTWDPFERRHANNIGAIFQAMTVGRCAALGLDGAMVWHLKGDAYGLIDAKDDIRSTGRLFEIGRRYLVGRRATVTAGGQLEIIAVERSDGVHSALLINKADHTLQVDSASLPTTHTQLHGFRIDASGVSTILAGQTDSVLVTLPGYSLTLLTNEEGQLRGLVGR